MMATIFVKEDLVFCSVKGTRCIFENLVSILPYADGFNLGLIGRQENCKVLFSLGPRSTSGDSWSRNR
jgi:hypothetical protein